MTSTRAADRRGRAAEAVDYPADPYELMMLLAERGLSDGLPVIPPTADRVEAMLQYTDREPLEILAVLAPKRGEATTQAIAICAVMAGCAPRYFPVVLAAVEALADERYVLTGINATTHPCAAMVLVNGPIGAEIGVASGSGCMGPGFHANATIGRAVRQVLLNIAGAIPGRGDSATHGTPAKFSFCFAENEDETPWEPFHVKRGFEARVSTVTVSASEAPHNIVDSYSTTGEGLLKTFAGSLGQTGSNNMTTGGEPMLVIGPEIAALLDAEGWTRERVQDYLFEHARFPVRLLSPERRARAAERLGGASYISSEDLAGDAMETAHATLTDDDGVPVVNAPEDLHVIVAGGPGKHSVWIPTFGAVTRPVTVPITDRDGTPVRSVEDLRR